MPAAPQALSHQGLVSDMVCWPQVRPPMPPAHLFLVDVSHQAVSTGLTAAACAAIAAVLDDLQGACCACLPGSKLGRRPGQHMRGISAGLRHS